MKKYLITAMCVLFVLVSFSQAFADATLAKPTKDITGNWIQRGDLTVIGIFTVGGTSYTVALNNGLSIGGAASIDGEGYAIFNTTIINTPAFSATPGRVFEYTGNGFINGTLTIIRAVDIGSALNVGAETTTIGLIVNGTAFSATPGRVLESIGNALINGTLLVTRDVQLNNGLTVSGPVDVARLVVRGELLAQGMTNSIGHTYITNTTVSGLADIENLTVRGTIEAQGDINQTGAFTNLTNTTVAGFVNALSHFILSNAIYNVTTNTWILNGTAASSTPMQLEVNGNSIFNSGIFQVGNDFYVRTSTGFVGIGVNEPQNVFHVRASGGELTGAGKPSGEGMTFQRTASGHNSAIDIQSAANGGSYLVFGHETNRATGFIRYLHSGNLMSFFPNGVQSTLDLNIALTHINPFELDSDTVISGLNEVFVIYNAGTAEVQFRVPVDIDATINVDGNTTLSKTLINTTSQGDNKGLTVEDNSLFNGTSQFTGAATFGSTLNVDSVATLTILAVNSPTMDMPDDSASKAYMETGLVINDVDPLAIYPSDVIQRSDGAGHFIVNAANGEPYFCGADGQCKSIIPDFAHHNAYLDNADATFGDGGSQGQYQTIANVVAAHADDGITLNTTAGVMTIGSGFNGMYENIFTSAIEAGNSADNIECHAFKNDTTELANIGSEGTTAVGSKPVSLAGAGHVRLADADTVEIKCKNTDNDTYDVHYLNWVLKRIAD